MAPADLLRPLEGQREETLRVLDQIEESDLGCVDRSSGWSVRQLFAHLASSELGEAFLIRRALDGELVHMSHEDRDRFNEAQVEGCEDWDVGRIRRELNEARLGLREVFAGMEEEDLDRAIRWPEWPARTIRTSIPYMLEHEDSHLDLVKKALGK
jgi:hypothetical protein